MNNFRLTTFLGSNIDIDENIIENLLENCKVKFVSKGEYILHQGEQCKHSFFVERGLLRQYGIDDKGKEHILQFAPENWFLTDRESVFFNQPSKFFIQSLEPGKILMLDENFVSNLAKTIPSFVELNTRLLHSHIRQQTKRIYGLLSATAEERYLDFINLYPDILLRVPQIMVASYLGITPESLSRVRKSLAEKNFKK